MSEPQETRKPSKLKLTYIVTAVAISCLMIGVSFGIITRGTSPASAPPTIIYPDELQVYKMNGVRYVGPDGTNDPGRINDALDDVAGIGGGLVMLALGTYDMNASIMVHSNTALAGAGPGTKLVFESGVLGGITFGSGATNIMVCNLWAKGAGATSPNANGITGAYLNNVTIENCYASEWSDDMILFEGPYARNIKILNNFVLDGPEGIEVKGGSNYTISGNHVWNVSQPLEITSREPYDNFIRDVLVSENIFAGTQRGIWFYGNVSRVIITDNSIEGTTESAILTSPTSVSSYPENILISGNTIKDSHYGLAFTTQTMNPRDFLVQGNMFIRLSEKGIWFNTPCQNISIIGNQFHDITVTGGGTAIAVRLSSPVTNLVINQNVFTNVKSYTIYELGPGTMVQGNSFFNDVGGANALSINGNNCTVTGNLFRTDATNAIYINTGITNTTIIANGFSGCSYAVYSAGTSDYTYLIGNNLKGCLTGTGYSLTGSNNVISNNTGI